MFYAKCAFDFHFAKFSLKVNIYYPFFVVIIDIFSMTYFGDFNDLSIYITLKTCNTTKQFVCG